MLMKSSVFEKEKHTWFCSPAEQKEFPLTAAPPAPSALYPPMGSRRAHGK